MSNVQIYKKKELQPSDSDVSMLTTMRGGNGKR